MSVYRWLVLIGIVVIVGCLQVAQRTAVFLKGYGLGERSNQIHAQETEVLWLKAQTISLVSPRRLLDEAGRLASHKQRGSIASPQGLRVVSIRGRGDGTND